MRSIGFIGAGNMGGALARAAAKCEGIKIYVTDTDARKATVLAAEIGATAVTAEEIAEICQLIFLGVKPAAVVAALSPIASVIRESGATVVSMAAGVTVAKIEEIIGKSAPVLRIMPNMPASVGKGMILWKKNEAVTDGALELFLSAMAFAGRLDELDERLIDAGSAISGCGPAFVYMFIEALADGGVKCGLTRDKAMLYAAQTLIGGANAVLKTGQHPGALKDAVCSPGGSTIEGVHALEAGALRATVIDAVVAAYERTKELGK